MFHTGDKTIPVPIVFLNTGFSQSSQM